MADNQKLASHSPKHFAYIDALRGYAILAVILVHVQNDFPNLPSYLRPILVQGARGVQLFFVLSAFTLMLSWHARGSRPLAFYIRRVFRIVPLFWIAIVIYTLIQGMGPTYWAPNGMHWQYILATFLFVHGWYPESINSVVPGGWSIAVEMNFYLLFPIAVRCIGSAKRALIALVFATLVAHYSNIGIQLLINSHATNLPPYLVSSYAMLWLFNQAPSFIVGILVYYLLKDHPHIPRKFAETLLGLSFLCLVYLCFYPSPNYLYYFSFAFGAILFAMAQGAGKIFVNRLAIFAGKVSFGAYLCQFIIIDHLHKWAIAHEFASSEGHPTIFFCCIYASNVALTLIVSYGLHLAIEKPMIALGHRLSATRSAESANNA